VWNENPKAFKWWREHGGELVQKVRLENLEMEIIAFLELCLRLEVEAEGSIPIRFEC
tara:strand:+ start:273 stop:443 length:171 start_codon:yes stop_codon:yes gene_type:complete